MNEFLTDDKNMVIIAVIILGVGVLLKDSLNPEAATIMGNIFSGLFGIAVGRATLKG